MGSYCELYFDKMPICAVKSEVPDGFCALFQESDRFVRRPGGDADESPQIVYKATREVILSRLSLLGLTASVARERLTFWLAATRATWEEYDDDTEQPSDTVLALRSFSVDEWYRRVPEVLASLFTLDDPLDEIDRCMREHTDGWLWFDGYGSLVTLRALLEACTYVQIVELDITELIANGYIEPEARICSDRRISAPLAPLPLAPTLIIAEGRSDIEVLQRSLVALYPERQDYFSFFNHAELSVDGGTNYLVKFLKAFAAARAPLRLVAVLDNDTVGRQAYRQANKLALPHNFMVVSLPDTEFARTYPTVGPQGEHVLDVNGKAASIELYLGRAALTEKGRLRPVRWTGYISAEQAYQGEIEGKAEVVASFLADIAAHSNAVEARAAFPELADVWQAIFRMVERSAEDAERKSHDRFALLGWF